MLKVDNIIPLWRFMISNQYQYRNMRVIRKNEYLNINNEQRRHICGASFNAWKLEVLCNVVYLSRTYEQVDSDRYIWTKV